MKKILTLILTFSVLCCTGCALDNSTVEPIYANDYVEVYSDINDNYIKLNPRTKTFELHTYGNQVNISGNYEDNNESIVLHSNQDTGGYKVFTKQGSRLRYDEYRSTDTMTLHEGANFERR